MKKKITNILVDFLVLLLVFILSGCSFALNRNLTKEISDDELITSVSKIVDEQLDIVSPYFSQTAKAIDFDSYDGKQIVENALIEERGKEYLSFNYDVVFDGESNLDEIAQRAKELIPESEEYRIDEKLNSTKQILKKDITKVSKLVPPSQQIAFQKDLRKLVIRSFVLFTAGVVYIFMPDTVFWGKVSAAAAISVATGVLSCTIMSLYQYYKYGGEAQEAFAQWVNEVSTEPQVSYALANSMIAVGSTMKRSPVVTGIMICVFSMYQVIDMLKPMLKKYNYVL
ncbi:MAG: hypothetical protein ACPKOI_09100 [Pleomorphochaeta sp.]|jgi:hypothetical protein